MSTAITEALPLATGQRMDRATFHARYQETPEDFKAELIDGVVFVASPITNNHSRPHFVLMNILGYYEFHTPGVRGYAEQTCVVDELSEVEPDAMLAILPDHGGLSDFDECGYLIGLPELVVEVSYTTVDRDLKTKRKLYEQHGVLEYVVYRADTHEVNWFCRTDRGFVRMPADGDGLTRSVCFPGLQFRVEEIASNDTTAILRTLQLGLSSQAHADFVALLAARRSS